MSKVLFNGSIQGFSGRIGNLLFRQMPDGSTVVSKLPPKKTGRQKQRARLKRSPRQQAHNSRFEEATAYGKAAARTHPVYAERAAAAKMKTAYNFAVSDWFHPPEIHRIERADGCIRVEASDNIMVKKVRIAVLNEEGGVLEQGEAVRGEGNWWTFASQAQGKTVLAEAWDLPGNVTQFVLEP